LLLALLTTSGLVIAIQNYEVSYVKVHAMSDYYSFEEELVENTLLMFVTFMALGCLSFRIWLKQYW